MRVLVVEDDPELGPQIVDMLRAENFAVDLADDGAEALQQGMDQTFDAVILDPGMPTMDGFTVLRKWRAAGLSMPVIVLTGSRKEIGDMKEGVRAGATNYLTKPVDFELLLDWLRGVVNSAGPNVKPVRIELDDLIIDTQTMRVTLAGKPVKVTPTEYRILHYLAVNAGKPISAEEMVSHNFDGDTLKTKDEVPVFISRLRGKLGRNSIETVFGFGYRLTLGSQGN
jgi:two-component system OmpR family response regulator